MGVLVELPSLLHVLSQQFDSSHVVSLLGSSNNVTECFCIHYKYEHHSLVQVPDSDICHHSDTMVLCHALHSTATFRDHQRFAFEGSPGRVNFDSAVWHESPSRRRSQSAFHP